MAGYFSYVPNIYVANGVKDDEAVEYTLVKNLFKRLVVGEDIAFKFTAFELVTIEPGDTPSSIATEYYSDPFLDWVILLTNNITDVYEQWPKGELELLQYCRKKYNDRLGDTHHWETQEIEYEGEVFIKEGIEVQEDFRVTFPDGTSLPKANTITRVTNYEHEEYLNDLKRFIRLPTPTTVALMKDEMEEGLVYKNCPELDEQGFKKTPISLVSRFLTANNAVTRQQVGPLDLSYILENQNQPNPSAPIGIKYSEVPLPASPIDPTLDDAEEPYDPEDIDLDEVLDDEEE